MEKTLPCCPECEADDPYRAGFYYPERGQAQQRYQCRECGIRYRSEPNTLKTKLDISKSNQIGVFLKDMKNLVPETTTQNVSGKSSLQRQTLNGQLLEFAFWMQKQGYRPSTVESRIAKLKMLGTRGAELDYSESVKKTIALQKTWSDGTKAGVVNAYSCFLQKEGLTWDPPRYKRQEKIPFIPSETELNMLIAAGRKKLSIFLQGLKETGADPGELAEITNTDINKETCTITLNNPVKGHRPRIITVSPELIRRLETMVTHTEKIFNYARLRNSFNYMRKVSARKLSNPRLRNITFITFRHWFGTSEYHRTRDILHVQRLLGHKSIQNTLIYIDLESKLFKSQNDNFTVRVAHDTGESCSLTESGFEYVTGEYHDGGKIFRKRK